MRFSDFHLLPAIEQAISEQGYDKPTPIQQRAIPPGLEGLDVLGIAQTGTGKTAAFALPILNRLGQDPTQASGRRHTRVLVLAPTRELAAQIGESFRDYGRHLHLKSAVIFGGVGQKPQEDEVRRGLDILVACPGRLLDLMNQGIVNLGSVEHLVLDEADRMLDMGFLPDIRRIVSKVPKDRQTMFFSATMPEEINRLASDMLRDPVTVEVTPVATAAETVEQFLVAVSKDDKVGLLESLVKQTSGRVLVFTRTKHGADRVVRKLDKGDVAAAAIHGDKSQGARTKALEGFRKGTIPVLVASDIAARGLDIDEIRLVVNYDIPGDPDTYVHRIGRTGRAGATGRAITFVTPDDEEELRDIEKRINRAIPTLEGAPAPVRRAVKAPPQPKPKAPAQNASRRGGNAPREQGEGRAPKESGRGGNRSGRGKGSSGAKDNSRQQQERSPKAAGSGRSAEGAKGRSGRPQGEGRPSKESSRSNNRRGDRRDDRSGGAGRDERHGEPRSLGEQRTASGRPLPKLTQPGENPIKKLWKKFTGG